MSRNPASLCEVKKIESSSQVNRTAYCHDTHDLIVEFKTGGLYLYSGVPPEVIQALYDAESLGSYLSKNIVPNYKCVNLTFITEWYQTTK